MNEWGNEVFNFMFSFTGEPDRDEDRTATADFTEAGCKGAGGGRMSPSAT